MNDFTASNGVRVVDLGGKWDQSLFQFAGEIPGLVDEIRQVREVNFQDPDVTALREFFQAEADERLGRWRWPENPDYVVYPLGSDEGGGPRFAKVLYETTGSSGTFKEGYNRYPEATAPDAQAANAAVAYFDAHSEPKPWHDAKPGEVWLLTIDGEAMPVRVFEGSPSFSGLRFETYDRGPFGRAATAITAGRRIWPEVAS